ncbi:putative terpene synthase 13 [Nymphaea thermarum]|nr:putative terpene synthase 13 [Nymphaea thermarum]
MSTTSCLSPWPSVIIDQRPKLARGAAASCSWRMQQREALNKNVSNSTSSATQLNGNLPLVPRLNPNYRSSSSEHNMVSLLARERKVVSLQRMEALKNKVRLILRSAANTSEMLSLVDAIQQLGIAYYFEEEIGNILISVRGNLLNDGMIKEHDLHDVSLAFRLLRQHGCYVSPGVFDSFKDGKGAFKHELEQDVRGLLSLYEASFLGMDGEVSLHEARSFATSQLQPFRQASTKVARALEQPFHHSLAGFQARRYIQDCQDQEDWKHGILIELAKLDCDYTQSLYQKELWEVSKWWKGLGLAEELGFIRDQVLVWFMFPLSMLPEPHLWDCRLNIAKVVALIYTIDDIYDVHGSMEELQLFTETVARWDQGFVHTLPAYLRTCFMALHDVTLEIQSHVQKRHGHDVFDKLKQVWATLTQAYMEEAKWKSTRFMPKTEEYLRNRVVSTGLPASSVHVYYLMGFSEPKDGPVDALLQRQGLVWYSAMILRLWDDLGSTMDEQERGYDASYIECYMKEFGVTEEEAREHVEQMIGSAWEKLNRECLVLPTNPNPFPPSFARVALNAARACPVMYQCEKDGRLLDLEGHIKTLVVDRI